MGQPKMKIKSSSSKKTLLMTPMIPVQSLELLDLFSEVMGDLIHIRLSKQQIIILFLEHFLRPAMDAYNAGDTDELLEFLTELQIPPHLRDGNRPTVVYKEPLTS